MGVLKKMWAIKRAEPQEQGVSYVYSTQLRIYWQEVGEISE